MIRIPEKPKGDMCPEGVGCPKCSERRHDQLAWDEVERLHCQTSGHAYDPENRPPDAIHG